MNFDFTPFPQYTAQQYVAMRLTDAAALATEIVTRFKAAPEVFADEPGQREFNVYGLYVLVTRAPMGDFSIMWMDSEGSLRDAGFTQFLAYVLRRYW